MIIIKIILWVIAIGVIIFILGWINAIRASFTRDKKILKKIHPAIEAVNSGNPNAKKFISDLAKDPSTRNTLYRKLKEINKEDLFPKEYISIEKVAESDLVLWLLHPNELNASPSEIELVRGLNIKEDDKSGLIYLFKFRVESSHWAHDKGWMAGVAGPFWENEDIFNPTSIGTFSELTPFESMTEEEHVNFLKESLNKKGLVVLS